jgi:ribonuclease PH
MEALSPAVVAPSDGGKTVVEVFVYVLQGDGCVFDAAVVGASLALADAGVPMRDAVTAGTAAVMRLDDNGGAATMTTATAARGAAVVPRYAVIADPTEDEVLRACGVVTIALMPNWREVTSWDQFGRMPPGAAAEATELARCGCATMHKFLRNCLLTTTTRNDGGGER